MTIDVIIGEKVSHIVFDGIKHSVEHVRASLAAVPESEPVAWRYPDGEWTDGAPRYSYFDRGHPDEFAERLFAAAPAPVSGVPDLASLDSYWLAADGIQTTFVKLADVERLLNPTGSTK